MDDDSGAEPDGAIASVLLVKYRRENILNAEQFPIRKRVLDDLLRVAITRRAGLNLQLHRDI